VQKGLRSLGRVSELLGPYQGSAVFVMRPWAQAHPQWRAGHSAARLNAVASTSRTAAEVFT
jgi:hypothetical protein